MSDDVKNKDEQPEVELTEVLEAEEETQEDAAENIRKRAARDHDDARKYAVTGFARDLLSVADNFSRALESIAGVDLSNLPPQVQSLIDGLKLTEKELSGIFDRQGVKKVVPLGEPFNHDLHQAICEIPTAEYAPGIVAQVMQTGYTLHDRLLRPAMVGVAKAPE
jgi:molecular chaperone GrpE